ncbi:Pr6Pr family membrane protein [Microbacteriaceae bacterium VKM Ac-2855]|nr:Pr6Pr family membrane protein [Microbacteriaceae bacterium VKM Ac-2855]
MTSRPIIALTRSAIAVLGAIVVCNSVIVAQTSVGTAATADFLSSITALTNITAVVCFALASVVAWRESADSRWMTSFRVVVVTYLSAMSTLFLGIYGTTVFSDPNQLNVNTIILHLVIPAAALIEWLLSPGRRPVPLRILGWIAVFPVLWFFYTFIRGAMTGAYVYEFLNPSLAGGVQKIILMTVLILTIFFLFGAAFTVFQRWRSARIRAL